MQRMISSRACSRLRSPTARSLPRCRSRFRPRRGIPSSPSASRFALTGVFVVKTKAGDVRVAATGASQNGVMRVPAIEAALKANWSAGAAGQRDNFRGRPAERYPRLIGLSRQPDQGDGAARGDRSRLIAYSASNHASGAQRCAPLCIWSYSDQLTLATLSRKARQFS